MKKIILVLVCFFSASPLKASPFELPKGMYTFNKASITTTMHEVLLNLNVSEDSKRFQKLKIKGYRCSRVNTYFTKCTKFVDDSYEPSDFNKYKELELNFDNEIQVDVLNESESVSKFAITQKVLRGLNEVDGYILYINKEGSLMADFEFQKMKSRYQFIENNQINMLHIEREQISSNESKRHYINLVYTKDSV